MSRCDLEVILERPDGAFRAGETVAGMVVVRVNRDCACNGLDASLRWTTHGRGNRREGSVAKARLFTGEWKSGEELIHPFELAIPEDAIGTYHGQLLNVDWEVHATADIPWAFDPETSAILRITPSGGPHAAGPLFESERDSRSREAGTFPAAIFAVVWLAISALALGIPTALAFADPGPDSLIVIPLVLVFDVVFFGIGFGILFLTFAKRLTAQRLGEIRLVEPEGPLRPGEPFEVGINFTPKGTVPGRVLVSLVGQETVVSGSGTNKRTHTHELHELELELRPEGPMPAGQPIDLRTELQLPEGAPASFEASDNALRWEITYTIAVPNWPDWTASRLLYVIPG